VLEGEGEGEELGAGELLGGEVRVWA